MSIFSFAAGRVAEYLIKWLGKAHVHNEWVSRELLLRIAKRKLMNFERRCGCAPDASPSAHAGLSILTPHAATHTLDASRCHALARQQICPACPCQPQGIASIALVQEVERQTVCRCAGTRHATRWTWRGRCRSALSRGGRRPPAPAGRRLSSGPTWATTSAPGRRVSAPLGAPQAL